MFDIRVKFLLKISKIFPMPAKYTRKKHIKKLNIKKLACRRYIEMSKTAHKTMNKLFGRYVNTCSLRVLLHPTTSCCHKQELPDDNTLVFWQEHRISSLYAKGTEERLKIAECNIHT